MRPADRIAELEALTAQQPQQIDALQELTEQLQARVQELEGQRASN